MKRVIGMLAACALAVLLLSPGAAQASSATVVFSGPEKVKAGQTYTYTYKIEVDGVAAARVVPITASGGFEVVSGGEGLMYDTIPNNTSGSSNQGTIVVKVKNSTKTGEKCTLSTSGDYAVLAEDYSEKEYTFSGSFIATVSSGPAKEDTPTPTPAATLSPTPSPEPSASPVVTASPAPSPSVSAETSAAISASPAPSVEQAAETTPMALAASATATAPAAAEHPKDSISVTAIVVGALGLVLVALVVIFFVRNKRPQGKGSPGNEASAVTADSRTMRRRAYRKKRRRYKR
jgi:hypothetical protein